MVFDDGDCHNVKFGAGVSVLRVRELFVTPAFVVCTLNLAVNPPTIGRHYSLVDALDIYLLTSLFR